MNLSPKALNRFELILAKIKEGFFIEEDIEILLLLLRPFSKGIISELASFIAHQEQRTKGYFQELLDTNYMILKYSFLGKEKEEINPICIHELVFNNLII